MGIVTREGQAAVGCGGYPARAGLGVASPADLEGMELPWRTQRCLQECGRHFKQLMQDAGDPAADSSAATADEYAALQG